MRLKLSEDIQSITALIAQRRVEKGSGRQSTLPGRERCVQPDQHSHCLQGKLGDSAERRGGPRMGLSELCGAALNGSWKWLGVRLEHEGPGTIQD